MPILTQILCDGCRAVKQETNHWYTLVVDEPPTVCLRPMAHTPPSLLQPGAAHVLYFCGRYCAIEGITQWMDTLTFDARESADASQSTTGPGGVTATGAAGVQAKRCTSRTADRRRSRSLSPVPDDIHAT
jgi:hypothetical protein